MTTEISIYSHPNSPDQIMTATILSTITTFCANPRLSDGLVRELLQKDYTDLWVAYSRNENKLTIKGLMNIKIHEDGTPEVKTICARGAGGLFMNLVTQLYKDPIFVYSVEDAYDFYKKYGFVHTGHIIDVEERYKNKTNYVKNLLGIENFMVFDKKLQKTPSTRRRSRSRSRARQVKRGKS